MHKCPRVGITPLPFVIPIPLLYRLKVSLKRKKLCLLLVITNKLLRLPVLEISFEIMHALLVQVEGIIKDIRDAVDPYARDGCTDHSTDQPGFQVGPGIHSIAVLVSLYLGFFF